MIDDDVQQFLGAVSETTNLWKSIDVRVVAAHVNGAWQNLATRIQLGHLRPKSLPRPADFPRLSYFVVLQEVYPLAELPKLVEAVRNGELEIDGHHVSFRTGDYTEAFQRPYSRSYAQIGRNIGEHVRGTYHYGHALSLYGDDASVVFGMLSRKEEGLNAALRALPDPWGGVSDVLLHALDDPMTLSGTAARRVTFVAPLQAQISVSDSLLVDGVLTYTIKASSTIAGKLCTLVITGIDANGGRVARRVPLVRREWVKDKHGVQYTGEEALHAAKHLTLTLQLATFELGQTEVEARREIAPLLLSAYNALFPGQRSFATALLNPIKTESRTFEEQVALLFTYCGMPVEYIGGGPKSQEAPDVLVQLSGTSIVLVVEITVGPLNQQGKLARLTQRAEQVRASIEAAGGHVLPFMVTANQRSLIAQNELDAAKADGIRVLSLDDLATMLNMAVRRSPARHIAKFLAPHLVRGSLPPLWTSHNRHQYASDNDPE
jgi:hypothetical protein